MSLIEELPGSSCLTTLFSQRERTGWSFSATKRVFDLIVASTALTIFSVPILAIAVLITVAGDGPILFRQKRVGRGGELFTIYKFRTMRTVAGESGCGLTRGGDGRVTPLGRWLRRLKLDELPQFLNVLRGEMSIVGPRPKVPDDEGLGMMLYRPGITGAATLVFRAEERLLKEIPTNQRDAFYATYLKPVKARLDAAYMRKATFLTDLGLILRTFFVRLQACRFPAAVYRKGFVSSMAGEPENLSLL